MPFFQKWREANVCLVWLPGSTISGGYQLFRKWMQYPWSIWIAIFFWPACYGPVSDMVSGIVSSRISHDVAQKYDDCTSKGFQKNLIIKWVKKLCECHLDWQDTSPLCCDMIWCYDMKYYDNIWYDDILIWLNKAFRSNFHLDRIFLLHARGRLASSSESFPIKKSSLEVTLMTFDHDDKFGSDYFWY